MPVRTEGKGGGDHHDAEGSAPQDGGGGGSSYMHERGGEDWYVDTPFARTGGGDAAKNTWVVESIGVCARDQAGVAAGLL